VSAAPTILAIRLRQLGDVLVTLGTLRAIKRAAPDRRIAFIVDDGYRDLLASVDFIDILLPQPPSMDGLGGAVRYNAYIDRLRAMDIECVLDFHSNSRSAILAYLSGAPQRIGFDVRGRKFLYTDVEPRTGFRNGRPRARTSHESAVALARRWLPSIADGSGSRTIPVGREDLATGQSMLAGLGCSERARGAGVVGLNPGNPYPAKEWPDANFVEVASRLVAAGREVVVLWGPGEVGRAAAIVEAAGKGVFLAPELALRQVPGFLRALSSVVTIDSGMKHIAVAVGTPTVTLFGPTTPDEWHVGGEQDRFLYARISCSPCRLLHCPFGDPPCMLRLTPDAVLAELERVEGGVRIESS
jgi:ADP-heptose:LPS heptosyltransferase